MSQQELESYQRDITYKHREDIKHIPPKYHGIVNSTIQYKYLRTEMIKMLGTLIDNSVPALCKSLQRITDALIEFSNAYGNNLGIYYSIYGMSGEIMQRILAERDTASADALMNAVIASLESGANLPKAANELKESLKQLERDIISATSNTNTQQLEINVEHAYEKARKAMMEVENLKRDLAIEKATKQMLEDSAVSDKELQSSYESRIRKECQSLESQQSCLDTAVAEDGKETTTTHESPYYGWRWWYYGGSYRYTTTTRKDTSSQQSSAKRNMTDIEERMHQLKKKLEQTQMSRNKRKEVTKANIDSISQQIKLLEVRRDNDLQVAKDLESTLSQARLLAAGCSGETSKKLTEAFKLTLPLFVELADNTAQVSVIFQTAKSIIISTQKMPVTSAISVFDSVTKLAIAGDFVLNNSFTIGKENTFRNHTNTLTTVYNQTVQAAKQLPIEMKSYENITKLVELNPTSKHELEQVAVASAVKPIDPEDIY